MAAPLPRLEPVNANFVPWQQSVTFSVITRPSLEELMEDVKEAIVEQAREGAWHGPSPRNSQILRSLVASPIVPTESRVGAFPTHKLISSHSSTRCS